MPVKKDQNATLIAGSINLPTWQWQVLKAAAHARQKRKGGRASVSALIAELVKERRRRLEKEGAEFLRVFTQ